MTSLTCTSGTDYNRRIRRLGADPRPALIPHEVSMYVIGLTGGIGSGKSTVACILEEQGAVILDADLVGHQVYEPGRPAWRASRFWHEHRGGIA